MPPARTGIAHYASMLVPELSRACDLTVISTPDELIADRRSPVAKRIYQLGNNPHHEWIYDEAIREPGVIVLHDVVLHHLIVEMTLARGDVEGYVAALERNHGAAAGAWARGRAAGLHTEMGNFLFPASIEVANRSLAVIVHNRWAADRLLSFGVQTPVYVVPHPYEERPLPPAEPHPKRVIGLFGFLTTAKRAEVVLEAFRRADDPNLELLIVGERAPNIDPRILTTGYVDDLDPWYARVDRLVNLRYPTAGETSGTLIRAFAAGKPVAVSDYAQFAEYPDDCVIKIPFGAGEVDALVDFFRRELDEASIARAQRQWLETNARMADTVSGYRRAVERRAGSPAGPGRRRAGPTFPLFARLAVVARRENILTVKNTGDVTLRTRAYGEPAYRILAKLFDGERELDDRWLELPGDLQPGAEMQIEVPTKEGATLRLYHALQGVPMLQPEPWYAAAL
ncbi:MAG TPA: glycosyltransferase [Thermoanaerobaculia bacterium]|nr:glycosyltransferase [Thermoanaerobaculia bacterium]